MPRRQIKHQPVCTHRELGQNNKIIDVLCEMVNKQHARESRTEQLKRRSHNKLCKTAEIHTKSVGEKVGKFSQENTSPIQRTMKLQKCTYSRRGN